LSDNAVLYIIFAAARVSRRSLSFRAVAEQRLAPSPCYTARGRKVSQAPAAASLGITVLEVIQEHPVGRAPDTGRTPVEDVGVDHRGRRITKKKKFLDGPDVMALLQQVGGEGMTEGMADDRLGNAGCVNRVLHCTVHHLFVQML